MISKIPFLRHPRIRPFATIICIFLGIVFGILFPTVGVLLGPIGDFFISLFKMCALPLVIAMVIESFYRLNQRADRRAFIFRTFKVFFISAVTCCGIGVGMGALLSPLISGQQHMMDFLSSRMAAAPHVSIEPVNSAFEFFMRAVPQNIFKSLSEGQILSCLIFFALLGSGIARIKSPKKHDLYEIVQTLKDSLFWMLALFIQFLPLAVFCIFSNLFAGLGTEGAPLILTLAGIFLIPIIVAILIQWATLFIFRRKKFRKSALALRDSLFVAFSAGNSMVALPGATQALVDGGQIEAWVGETVMPLSITFNSQALIVFSAFNATMAACIYGLNIKSGLALMIVLGSLLQGICGSGLPAMATIGTMSMIFGPIGVPVDLMVIILITATPFLSPFLAVLNLNGYAWSALMVERRSAFRGEAPAATGTSTTEAPTTVG